MEAAAVEAYRVAPEDSAVIDTAEAWKHRKTSAEVPEGWPPGFSAAGGEGTCTYDIEITASVNNSDEVGDAATLGSRL